MSPKIKHILIANEAEAFAKIIGTIPDKKTRVARINFENYLANRSLFWEGDNKIIITSCLIDPVLLKAANHRFGIKNIVNLCPSKIKMNLSNSILQDRNLLGKLKKTIRENPFIRISPYAYTKDFQILITELRKSKLSFYVDQEPTSGNYEIVQHLDSKIGFRTEVSALQAMGQKIFSPKFFICKTKAGAKAAATTFYKNGLSCVIKASLGEGGWGLLVLQKYSYKSTFSLEKYIGAQFAKDSIWKKGSIVVEEFVTSSNTRADSPSLEFFLDDSGPRITYICNQLLSQSGAFLGVLIGKSSVIPKIKSEVDCVGLIIARRYWELGYRGFFDIDFVISKSGVIFPIETNARRTGGTHVFDLTQKIFGKNWEEKTLSLSSDSFKYGEEVLPAETILKKNSPISFPMNGRKKGVVITIIDSQRPVFGFIIFAPTQGEILRIHEKLTGLWNRDIVTPL